MATSCRGCCCHPLRPPGFLEQPTTRVLPVKIGAGQKSKLWPRAGPSLRWVTATMTKATRRQSQEGLQYRRISRSRWAGVLLVALVWDGLAAHLGKLLRAWLGRQRSWLVVEPRRATPEFNPVEPLWASLKGTGLANLVGDTLEEIIAAAERGIQRIRATPNLPLSFLRHCGLSLW